MMKKQEGTIFQKNISKSKNKKPDEEVVEKKQQENKKKLDTLLTATDSVLYKTSTFFPFNFFPDEMSIGMDKVNVTIRWFFFSGQVESMDIKNIQDVEVESGPFFATLKISSNTLLVPTIIVKYLKKKDAMKAREIIQGLMLAQRSGVDVASIKDKKLPEKIEKLGKAQGLNPV